MLCVLSQLKVSRNALHIYLLCMVEFQQFIIFAIIGQKKLPQISMFDYDVNLQ